MVSATATNFRLDREQRALAAHVSQIIDNGLAALTFDATLPAFLAGREIFTVAAPILRARIPKSKKQTHNFDIVPTLFNQFASADVRAFRLACVVGATGHCLNRVAARFGLRELRATAATKGPRQQRARIALALLLGECTWRKAGEAERAGYLLHHVCAEILRRGTP